MSDMILDEAMSARFDQVKEPVRLRDRNGRTLGYFRPAAPYPRWIHEEADARITDEELDRRSKEDRGFATAEVLDSLKGL